MIAWLSPGMSAIRLAADVSLALSIPVLLFKMYKTGHEGISFNSQILHLIVFVARYADLLTGYVVSSYNTVGKLWLLFGTLACILVFVHLHRTSGCTNATCISKESLRHQVLLLTISCVALGYVWNYHPIYIFPDNWGTSAIEWAWASSMYLAAVADVPQLCQLRKSENKDGYLVLYMLLVFAFRALYIPHWYLRYRGEGMVDLIASVPGVVQTEISLVFGIIMLHNQLHRKRGDSGLPTNKLSEADRPVETPFPQDKKDLLPREASWVHVEVADVASAV